MEKKPDAPFQLVAELEDGSWTKVADLAGAVDWPAALGRGPVSYELSVTFEKNEHWRDLLDRLGADEPPRTARIRNFHPSIDGEYAIERVEGDVVHAVRESDGLRISFQVGP